MNENTNTNGSNGNITINGDVTINVSETPKIPIDRTGEVLISNDTTFNELLSILGRNPEVLKNAEAEEADRKAEADAEKKRKAREAEQRELFGEDYEYLKDMEDDSHSGDAEPKALKKARRRPGAVQLRTYVPMVAKLEYECGGVIEAYENGYCVYDNGNRKTVVWILDCGSYTYMFGQLKDKEKEYLKQKDELSADYLGSLPWYQAVMLRGEDQIWKNSEHPKSKGTMSDEDEGIDVDVTPDYRWCCGAHIETPEEYVMRIEAEREIRNKINELKPGHRELIHMTFFEEKTQKDISKEIGRSQSSISERLMNAEKELSEKLKDLK